MAPVGFQISVLKNTPPICACKGCSEQLIDSDSTETQTS